ncbi:MAG: bifunctional salicylyl-CoA 5-hydroxylase/oxidoreductase [Acidobacteriota bacterium]
MKIVVVGGGPGGLYSAILLKTRQPEHDITVLERNGPADTFGWGVVFSDETLEGLDAADETSSQRITESFAYWSAIDNFVAGEHFRCDGHGFAGIARKKLLAILQERCRELGVELKFHVEVEDALAEHGDCDLLIAADGVNSRIRSQHEERFRPSLREGQARYTWLGTRRHFDAFTFVFKENEHGVFQVHAYAFDDETSTFIIETDDATWRRAGLDTMSEEEWVGYCERLFAEELDGHSLLTNKSEWIRFREVKNESWSFATESGTQVVLIGDAAHTAHFSIGSGTKLAIEDAIALADALESDEPLADALRSYENARRLVVEKTQGAALHSQNWFEQTARHVQRRPLQLTYSLMSRSKKLTHENLRLRDPGFVDRVDEDFARCAGWDGDGPLPPPMFCPLRLADVELVNRVVVSPMCTYMAEDGLVTDWHLVHLGSRALGGAGLVMTEMTDVTEDGRISPGCAGLYTDEQVAAWARIVDFIHDQSSAKIGIQLAHAGRKGSTRRLWEGIDRPLPDGNWPLIAPSPIPWTDENQVPREMTRQDMVAVRDAFAAATKRAEQAGFDHLELHLAHGYLLASFLSPLTNQRSDEHGGSLENRMRYPLEVFEAVREAWPSGASLAVRMPATDWLEGGWTTDDALVLAAALAERGCDLLDVSAGQTTPESHPAFYGRMFLTPFAELLRNEVGIKTMAVGGITSPGQVNTILAAGRADLCALAREHLRDPAFTQRAAAELGWSGGPWPAPYSTVRPRPTPPV